jgi:hypothetical protein
MVAPLIGVSSTVWDRWQRADRKLTSTLGWLDRPPSAPFVKYTDATKNVTMSGPIAPLECAPMPMCAPRLPLAQVGFNAGHSTAIWLASNPTVQVRSFCLLDRSWSAGAVRVLQDMFPGRLSVFKGDSAKSIPRWSAANPDFVCDLIHIDGAHSYVHVVADFINLRAHARSHSLFMFDDQCDPQDCGSNKDAPYLSSFLCTLATCDLVSARMLSPLVGFYNGTRHFSLYRTGPARWPLQTSLWTNPSTGAKLRRLPCSPLCPMANASSFARSIRPESLLSRMRGVRERNCSLKMAWMLGDASR